LQLIARHWICLWKFIPQGSQGHTFALFARDVSTDRKSPVPVQDCNVLLKLIHLDLAASPAVAPVKKVTIERHRAYKYTQAGLFQRLAPEPARLEDRDGPNTGLSLARKIRMAESESDFVALQDSNRPDDRQLSPR